MKPTRNMAPEHEHDELGVSVLEPPPRGTSRKSASNRPDHAAWLQWWDPRRDTGIDYELLWGAVIGAVLVGAHLLPAPLFTWYQCPFRRITGVPCPTCGMTRATLHVVHLEWDGALALNPLGTVALVFAAVYVCYAVVVTLGRLRRPRLDVRSRAGVLFFRGVLPTLLVVNWIYLIVHGV